MLLFQGRGKPAQRPAAADLLRGLIGGGLSVYMLLALTEYSGHMWIMAPFGASCVLLYAAPQSPLAQPRNIILGHLISAFVGLCFAHWLPVNMFSISLAAGLAIACMQFLDCVHPPAGANPLLILLTAQTAQYGWSFLLFPVLAGAVSLVAAAYAVNHLALLAQRPAKRLALFFARLKAEKG